MVKNCRLHTKFSNRFSVECPQSSLSNSVNNFAKDKHPNLRFLNPYYNIAPGLTKAKYLWEIIKITCVSSQSIMVLMICGLASKVPSTSVKYVVDLLSAKNIFVDQSTSSPKNQFFWRISFPPEDGFSI